MTIILFLLLGLGISGGAIAYMLVILKQKGGTSGSSVVQKYKDELVRRKGIVDEIEGLYTQMVDLKNLQQQGKILITVKEALKTERGRTTITQAELETVEARLRELEEIERELAASNIDTQEEIKILEKKKADLGSKNSALKEQISMSLSQIDNVMGELELSSQAREQVESMKVEILQTQEKIETILLQIEQANEQYFVLKKRYDALDIEYAQLYEKFSAAEEAAKEQK